MKIALIYGSAPITSLKGGIEIYNNRLYNFLKKHHEVDLFHKPNRATKIEYKDIMLHDIVLVSAHKQLQDVIEMSPELYDEPKIVVIPHECSPGQEKIIRKNPTKTRYIKVTQNSNSELYRELGLSSFTIPHYSRLERYYNPTVVKIPKRAIVISRPDKAKGVVESCVKAIKDGYNPVYLGGSMQELEELGVEQLGKITDEARIAEEIMKSEILYHHPNVKEGGPLVLVEAVSLGVPVDVNENCASYIPWMSDKDTNLREQYMDTLI